MAPLLPPAGGLVSFLLLGVSTAPSASDGVFWGPLATVADFEAALAYVAEGGVEHLWLLPTELPSGPAAEPWLPTLRLAAAQLQAGGRCVIEAPLYRRAWTDKATRVQLAGAAWHAARQPGPLFGADLCVTMLRASFALPPAVHAAFDALCNRKGGAGDPAVILSKVQKITEALGEERTTAKETPETSSEDTGNDTSRCGKLFHNSGPVLSPPPSWLPESLTKEVAEAARTYLSCVHNVPYSLGAWNNAVEAGTQLLRRCQGWKQAVDALRHTWRAQGEDHFAGLFDYHLDEHLPADLLTWVRRVAQEGVSAEYRGTQRARVKATPHPSLKDHVEEARQLIWQDATRGRVLLMSPEASEEELLDGVVSVPLARVPKYNPDRSVSSKGRVIWDARVVNELCHKEGHFPAAQPRYAEVVRLILWYKTRYPGIRVLLAKKDVSEAFKWLWVEQDDCRLFGADIPNEEEGPVENSSSLWSQDVPPPIG